MYWIALLFLSYHCHIITTEFCFKQRFSDIISCIRMQFNSLYFLRIKLIKDYKISTELMGARLGHISANKEPYLNQLACVILVHNWYRSTSTCFLVYSLEYTCSACCHEFDTSRTGSELNCMVSLVHVITWKTRDFTVDTCRHTKFVHIIRWIHVRKHMNWASWTHEFTKRTCEITGHCLLGWPPPGLGIWYYSPITSLCNQIIAMYPVI